MFLNVMTHMLLVGLIVKLLFPSLAIIKPKIKPTLP